MPQSRHPRNRNLRFSILRNPQNESAIQHIQCVIVHDIARSRWSGSADTIRHYILVTTHFRGMVSTHIAMKCTSTVVVKGTIDTATVINHPFAIWVVCNDLIVNRRRQNGLLGVFVFPIVIGQITLTHTHHVKPNQ